MSDDGRTVHIDTDYYEVRVWGDPDDEMDDVIETAERAADRAREDIEEMDSDGDNGGHYA